MPDFNDILLQQGHAAVASAIDSARPVEKSIPGDQLSLAQGVINKIGRQNMLATGSHLWMWSDKGLWRPVHDREIKQIAQNYLGSIGHKVSRSLVDSITDLIKTEVFNGEHLWKTRNDIINVANGVLYFNGSNFDLYQHRREYFCLTQVPVIYDRNAKAPRFEQFLMEVFSGDADFVEKATVLLELIGYSLCSHARYEQFVLLIGRGANGKSVVLELIRSLLGESNVSGVQPSQFNNKHQRAHLHLKLANIVSEIAEGAEIADAELKAIVSGEGMTAEEKHKPPFDFQPFCTVWIGTNHMPHTRDFSNALFRRATILTFNQTFTGVNADPLLKDKLAAELPGILNKALYAYGGVLQRGMFTQPHSSLNAKREWRLQADQVQQFVEEICEVAPEGRIASGILYASYQTWAKSSGISRQLNHRNFTQRLEKLGYLAIKGTAGKREITGIRQVHLSNNHNY